MKKYSSQGDIPRFISGEFPILGSSQFQTDRKSINEELEMELKNLRIEEEEGDTEISSVRESDKSMSNNEEAATLDCRPVKAIFKNLPLRRRLS